jgi:hypothetical protein
MAIKPLNERLDDLSGAEQNLAETPAKDDPLQQIALSNEPEEFEPVQVAGRMDVLKEVLKAPKRVKKPLIQEGEAVEKVGPYQVIKDAEPATTEKILEEAPKMPTSGKPSPTTVEVEAGVPETAFNLDLIKDEDGVKQFIEATAKQYGADKLEKVSYKEIAAKASEEGYDEAFLARLIDPNQPTLANPEQAYKMLLAITDAGKRAFDLGEQVKMAKADGTLTAELASQFQQAVALEGVLLKSARGRQADIARTLGIFSEARQSTAQRGQMLEGLMTETGGIESVFDLANKYTALDSRGARATLSEKTIGGNLKDIWFSTWINGLLSSPVTHAKNVAGNLFFGAYQIPERAVASAIGSARNFLFKGGEQGIKFNEVQAQAIGFLQGIREGGDIALTAFKKNEATDPFTKIESARAGRDAFDIDFGDSDTGKAVSNALRYWGKFVTLPGRALMAEDEFFKAVGYRMELNSLAVREGNTMYDNLVKSGVSPDDASRQSSELVAELLANPSADIDEAAKAASRTVTFTRELETSLQGMQRLGQNPLIKMFVPFIKTPTNIALESMSRTPGLNFASPRFWGDYNAGGVRRDQALARVTLGGALIYGAGSYALEGRLTGYGPMRNEDKKALEGTGWQQFSLVFDKNDISPELLEEFKSMTTVSYGGPDKVYVSYAGLEPLATLLAIASTSSEYSMMTPGGSDMEKIAMGGALGVYQYLGDQPMLQGFSEIMKVFTSGKKDGPGILADLMKKVVKQGTEFAIGGSPVGVHSSFIAMVERTMDPTKSNTMPNTMNVSATEPAARGFWEALNYYKSRNPLTSDSLPRGLDPLTGEVLKAGKGNLYEAFSPFKTSDGKFSPAHSVLVEFGVPMYIPSKSMDGVELSATQYNRLVELATADGRLADSIASYGKMPSIQSQAERDLASVQAMITQEISDAYTRARDMLVAEDPDLAEKVRDVVEARREYGKYKR